MSADEVEHFAAVVAHQQTVDGEVAALHILLRHFRINHAVRVPAVAVAHVRAERGNLDFQPIPWNQNHAELRTYCHTFRKQCRDLVRRGIRRHVVIGRFAAEQQVAHTSAHKQRLVAVAS